MILGQIKNEKDVMLFNRVNRTTNAWDRMSGLLGKSEPKENEGMLIDRCSMIHTWFMKFPIDIIFLDSVGRVLSLYEHLYPWKIAINLRAKMVLELRQGMIKKYGITLSQTLIWQEKPWKHI